VRPSLPERVLEAARRRRRPEPGPFWGGAGPSDPGSSAYGPGPGPYGPGTIPIGFGLAGCLRRVLMLGFILFALLVGLLFFVGEPLLQILLQILLSQ
jgi:hypothetical protein